MGINEFAGYLSVGLAAYLASVIASHFGYAFFPFIPGVVFVLAGLILTIFFIKDTSPFVHAETQTSNIPLLKNLWKETTWKHQNIGSVTLNGLVNNLTWTSQNQIGSKVEVDFFIFLLKRFPTKPFSR